MSENRTWHFKDDEFSPSPITGYTFGWTGIPDNNSQYLIAATEQYLDFHRFLSANLRSVHPKSPTGPIELGLSLRAGAIRVEIQIMGSIIEQALLSHARASGLVRLDGKETLGQLDQKWAKGGQGHLDPIAAQLSRFVPMRNTIHLERASQEANKANQDFFWKHVIAEEERVRADAEHIIAFLREFKNPGRLSR